MSDTHNINVDLVRAFGIKDWKDVVKVTLVIEAGKMPELTIKRCVMSADGLQTAVEMLKLAPQKP